MMMCQCHLINYNKWTTPMKNADNGKVMPV
jgi:hypothetical protein